MTISKRSRRGASLVETVIAIPLLGGLLMACNQFYLSFSHEVNVLNTYRASREAHRQLEATLAPALKWMVFIDKISTYVPNGPVFETVQTKTSYEKATWYWKNDGSVFQLLFPQLDAQKEKSGICLQDRRSTLLFDKQQQTLQLYQYGFIKDGLLVPCLGGPSSSFQNVDAFTWHEVADVQLVKQAGIGLELYVRFENEQEWMSFDGGLPEVM